MREKIRTEQLHFRIEPRLKKDFEKAVQKDKKTVTEVLIDSIRSYIHKITGERTP